MNIKSINKNSIFNNESYVIFISAISYSLQYNPLFLYNFLWLKYWEGSSLRTLISIIGLILCSININFKNIRFNYLILKVVFFLISFCLYGVFVGFVINGNIKLILAESSFYLELSSYLIIFSLINKNRLESLAKYIILYTGISNIISLFIFFIKYDSIVVRALTINNKIISRLVDFISPYTLILINLKNYFNNKIKYFLTIIFSITIILGSFRSIWIALLFTFILIKLIYLPKNRNPIKFIFSICVIFISILSIEYFLNSYFNIPGYILPRISDFIPAILVRISQSNQILVTLLSNKITFFIGNGFGKLSEFTNDFGFGPITTKQPLATLSNYYIVLLGQFGILGSSIFLSLIIKFLISCKSYLESKNSIVIISLITYLGFLSLTFPNFSHFPIAFILGLFINISLKK